MHSLTEISKKPYTCDKQRDSTLDPQIQSASFANRYMDSNKQPDNGIRSYTTLLAVWGSNDLNLTALSISFFVVKYESSFLSLLIISHLLHLIPLKLTPLSRNCHLTLNYVIWDQTTFLSDVEIVRDRAKREISLS